MMLISDIINNLTNIPFWLGSPSMLYNFVGIILYLIEVFIVFSVFGYMMGWIERKLLARAQLRHGPTYVGPWGILQNLADLIKLLAKQDILLDNADKLLYAVSLPLLLSVSVLIVLLLPYSPGLQATNFGFGILIVFTLIATMPLLLFCAGFATGNKFANIAAQRSVLVLLSYELPALIVIGTIAFLTRSYSIQQIVAAQSAHYYVLLMPIGFIVLFVTMLAELERPPFDVKEADNELIAGWLTDYSSPYYAISLYLDYTRMFLGSAILAILFFGGWLGPAFLPPFFWLIAKTFVIAVFIVMIRVTAFRMRIDRMLRMGWIWLLPLSLINLIITYILFVG